MIMRDAWPAFMLEGADSHNAGGATSGAFENHSDIAA